MSSVPVTIRKATTGDLDALLRLYVQLDAPNASTDRSQAADALAAMLGRDGLWLLIAESNGNPVGTTTVVLVPNLTHDARPWAQLENLVVDGAWRGQGVGRLLIEAALAIAREAGCYKLQLQSANHREGAHRFYERLGFTASSAGFRLYFGEVETAGGRSDADRDR